MRKRIFSLIVAVMVILLMSFGALAQDRMPAIPFDKMTDLQKKYAEEIVKGPRGALYGPFLPLIRSSELMDRAQKIGEYLRYKSAIGNRLTEFVIMIAARQWTQQVVWAIHEPIVLKQGVSPEIIKAIADGRRPEGMSNDEEMLYNFCMELHTNQSISDVTYDRPETLWRAWRDRYAGHQRILHVSRNGYERHPHRRGGRQAGALEEVPEVMG